MWITLSISDLQSKLAAAEYVAVTSAQLPEGKTAEEVVEEEISSTVNMVRGYVAGRSSNALGAGETIPNELKDAALVVIRNKVFTRLPGLKRLLDGPRVKEYEDAIEQLRDTAAGRFAVVPPVEASADQASGETIKVVRRTKRQSTRESWSGTL